MPIVPVFIPSLQPYAADHERHVHALEKVLRP